MADAIGTAFSVALPTVSVTTGPTWASDINTWGAEVEGRLETLIDSTSITLTTGDVKHSTRYVQLGACAGQTGGATWTKGSGAAAGYYAGAAAADTVEFALPLERSQRLTAVRMRGRSTATAWTFRLWKIDEAAGTRTQIGSTQTSGTATSIELLSITGLTETVASGYHYIAEWTAGAASTRCLAVLAEYDRQVAT